MWGFDCFFSSFSSNSRGVSILFNNNFEYEVLKEKRDLNGNYLALDVVIDKQKLTLLSLYGPNMDNPDFYDQIMNIIEDFGNERYLLCGDFNLVLCPHIDCYNYLHVNNPNARDKLIEIVDQCSLVDPFRELFQIYNDILGEKRHLLNKLDLIFFFFLIV
jgi:exonuclease III